MRLCTTISSTILLLTTALSTCFGQDELSFKTEYFDDSGGVMKSETEFIVVDRDSLTMDFYRQNFQRPYHYPEVFYNEEEKGQTIIEWASDEVKQDLSANWYFTSKFDNSGRVVEYSYSSCFICSQLAYTFNIEYDSLDRPILFTETQTGAKVEIQYLSDENIKSVTQFSAGKLWARTTLLDE